MEEQKEQKIQVLSRAFAIIECLSEYKSGVGITELANKTELSKSTTFRLVNALRNLGYVIKDEDSDKYALSLKFLQLSSMLLNQTELKVVAFPHLKRLAAATIQTVHLCVLRGDVAIYLDKVEAFNHSIRMFSEIGTSVPLHSSAVGKCLLAWMPDQKRQKILNSLVFKPRTEKTIVTLESFEEALELTRKNGYSIDDLENEEGIRCAAAPIRDYTGEVIAAISVSGGFSSLESEQFSSAVQLVRNTAEQISRELGAF